MLLFDLNVVALVLGCIFALSGIIVSKKPNAQQLIDKLVPYKAIIGVAMIVLAIVNFVRMLPHLADMFKSNMILNAAILTILGVSVLLGGVFGMPQIVRLAPGAEQKGRELTAKLAPYQALLGLVGLGATLIYFLYRFNIIKISLD